ncbi:MAG: hypothetical protein ACLGGX_06080 [Bdellovibrionia bacterium]
MRLIYLVFTLVFSASISAQALNLSAKLEQNESGSYQRMLKLTCESQEAQVCQQLCQHDSECTGAEPLCLNCAGTTWGLLKTLFTDVEKVYEAGAKFSLATLVEGLKAQKFVFLDSGSIYNYYGPSYSATMQSKINSLCPNSQQEAIMGVRLNASRIPEKIEFLVCKTPGESDLFLSIKERILKAQSLEPNSGTLTIKEKP